MALEREEFTAGIASLEKLFNQRCDAIERKVSEGFQRTNGRLDRAEDDIDAVEQSVAVLESQVDAASQTGSDRPARVTGIGAALASAAALIWQWLQRP